MAKISWRTVDEVIETDTYKELYYELVKRNIIDSFYNEDGITFYELIEFIVVNNEEQFTEAFSCSCENDWQDILKLIEPKITEEQYKRLTDVGIDTDYFKNLLRH